MKKYILIYTKARIRNKYCNEIQDDEEGDKDEDEDLDEVCDVTLYLQMRKEAK